MAKEPVTIDHEETAGGSLLDAFAGMKNGEEGRALPMATTHQTGSRIVGAQRVAVMRDEAKVLEKIKFIAAAAGENFYYRFPVRNRKENRVDYIEGPSVKAAMAVLRYYGNSAAECYAVDDMGAEWIFHARFIDYETGAELERPFRQNKASAFGGADRERARDIQFQIGVSKAVRNVIDGMLETFTEYAMSEAKKSLVEKIGKKLPQWRARLKERFVDEEKLDPERLRLVIGRPIDEMMAPDIARVVAMFKSVEDGFSTWDETFPPVPEKEEAKPAEGAEAESFAKGATREEQAKAAGADPKTGEVLPAKQTTSEALKSSLATEPAANAAADAQKPASEAPTAASDAKKPADNAPAATGDAPEPNLDEIRAAGKAAKAAGKSRAGLPKEYRVEGREREANAWLDGFAGREREPGEEG